MVDGAGRIDLRVVLAGGVGPLLACQDMEVVIGSVAASVALGANGGTEDDEVLGDAGVDDVHGAHGAAGVVEDVLLVQVDIVGVQAMQLRGDVAHDAARVVAVRRDATLSQILQVVRLEDVEDVGVLLDQIDQRREHANENGEVGEESRHGCRAGGFNNVLVSNWRWRDTERSN